MVEHATSASTSLDREQFSQRLREETELLCALETRGALSRRAPHASVEIEAWLIDRQGRPASQARAFVTALQLPRVVPGRTKFHVVLRIAAQPLADDGLATLARDLQTLWARCQETAQSMGLRLLSIGLLPTIDDADLGWTHLSDTLIGAPAQRQTLIHLDIESSRDRLCTEHRGITLAAAATSFSARLQLAPEAAARFYNAAVIASAASVGLAANAPYLFGADLWDDTRVPLLEQAIQTSTPRAADAMLCTGYAGSLAESFRANLGYPILEPRPFDEPPLRLVHLRRHNDTIWRWNRPQVDFDDDGTPHLAIEQRVMAPAPSPGDMVANLCFHIGLTASLATEPDPPELRLPLEAARASLRSAARGGLAAEVTWLDGERMPLRSLLIVDLIERAHEGLHQLGVADAVASRQLSLIERRVASGQTGAVWQRRFVNAHGRNFGLLTREYAARQLGGAPVHEWNLRRLT